MPLDATIDRMRSRARLAARLAVVLACLVYIASIPGAVLRALVLDAPVVTLPEEVRDRDGALDVFVTAAQGGAPIRGARVSGYARIEGRAHLAGTSITDESGRARLGELPRAEHWIVVEADGLARASRMVVIVAGARRLDVALEPEHTLEVRVRSEAGEPIVGAALEVRASDPFPVGARTDAEGRARVARLGAGPFSVKVRAGGFEDVERRGVAEGAPLVVTLSRQGAILARVTAPDGAPAAKARVWIGGPSLWPAREATTDDAGSVRVSGLSAGLYTVRAASGASVTPAEVAVTLEKGQEREVLLRLEAGVMISVEVVDEVDEAAVAGAEITLAEEGLSAFPLHARADKKGRAVLGPVARAPATLSVVADGFVSRTVGVAAGEGSARVMVSRGAVVLGKITDARGFTVDGASVRVIGTDTHGMPVDEDPIAREFRSAHFAVAARGLAPLVPAGELGVVPGPVPGIPPLGAAPAPPSAPGRAAPREPWVSGRDGTYRAEPVPAGRLRVVVHHPQYVDAVSEPFAAEPGKEARVDLVMQRGGSLEGKILDARKRGVGNARITLLSVHGAADRETRSGSDGSFAFAAVSPEVVLIVSREEDPTRTVARMVVAVPDGEKKSVEITLPDERPSLPVRVRARGRAVSGAQVGVASLDPASPARATVFTDARGEALVTGVLGLPLRAEIRAAGHAPAVKTTKPDAASLDVDLEPGEEVTGEVYAELRAPVSGASVTLRSEHGVLHARTDKAGHFRFADLAPGPARLVVRAPGKTTHDAPVTIARHDGRRPTEVARIELRDEATVRGVVVDEGGKPVAGARVGRDQVPTYLPVGSLPAGLAITDARGRFELGGLPAGPTSLEAYAAHLGRARVEGVQLLAGRVTEGVRVVLKREAAASEPVAAGGVAVTLGEAGADAGESRVVIVAVAEGSSAERAGLFPGDVVVAVDGRVVHTMEETRARLSGPARDDVLLSLSRAGRAITLHVSREAVRR